MKVQNKVIVVTGGGSGMGRELTLNLLSKMQRLSLLNKVHRCADTKVVAFKHAKQRCLIAAQVCVSTPDLFTASNVASKFSLSSHFTIPKYI